MGPAHQWVTPLTIELPWIHEAHYMVWVKTNSRRELLLKIILKLTLKTKDITVETCVGQFGSSSLKSVGRKTYAVSHRH